MAIKMENLAIKMGNSAIKMENLAIKTEKLETIEDQMQHKYTCNLCNKYYANDKQLKKHLLTLKHQNKLNPPENKNCCQNCKKQYVSSSGLWRHLQKCKPVQLETDDGSDDELFNNILSAVKRVGKMNLKVLTLWQEKHPGYKDVESKENDRYLKILTNVLSGETEEEILSNYGKIMKNISLVTVVDKNQERERLSRR